MIISKDVPLSEITLRKYEKPYALKDRDLVKKLCLSLGLLQPGDSRDVVVDVFHVILKGMKKRKAFTCSEIEKMVMQNRKLHKLPMLGIASSNIRRQIKRLRSLFLIEKLKTRYCVTEFVPLTETFNEKIERFLLSSILQRTKEYFAAIDEKFS
jgi:hypothetical protein